MKFVQTLALIFAAACPTTLAFAPTASHHSKSSALQAEKHNNFVTGATAVGAFFLGLGLSAQVATASVEGFSLPSYDASKGINLIDMSEDTSSVNTKIQADAKKRREIVDNSAEKAEMEKLRKAEKEGDSLLQMMSKQSDVERKAKIEAEKAETRANRWSTF